MTIPLPTRDEMLAIALPVVDVRERVTYRHPSEEARDTFLHAERRVLEGRP